MDKKNLDYSDIEEKDLDDVESDLEYKEEDDYENPIVRRAEFFLSKNYKQDIEKLMQLFPNKRSLFIDFAKIEEFDPKFADELLETPDLIIEGFKIACKQYRSSLLDESVGFEPIIRFFNLPDDKIIKIKNLSADNIGKLISVEGIVRQFTSVLPRISIAHWICKKCGMEINLAQDGFDLVMPKMCPECKHRDFDLDERSSIFMDYQKIEIQEPLDDLKGGEQSNTINIHTTEDIVNQFTAGDRILFTGILRLRRPEKKKTVYGKHLDCLHIEDTKQEYNEVEISPEDEERIKSLSRNPEVFTLVSKSVAPNIYGHEKIKEAIAMQLFGGVRKILKDKSKIRGNIHILLIGDPGTGKSQMLQYTTRVAPKSLYVVGKTASGAGLTATAVKDDFGEGGWTLKAGALVLASGGFAMVDEFDKMSTEDRSAMHEAMEQETVSIAKAGIVTSFKTETCVLAAANPKYGRFDNYKNIAEQIDIPPALLSRFDLFFVLRDVLDEKRDKKTIMSILNTQKQGELIRRNELDNDFLDTKQEETMIDAEFLKKYISYARTRIFPVMSEGAMSKIQKFFLDMRRMSQDGRVSITYRQLEALVRLSEASARVKLSEKVTSEDAENAINLFKYSMGEVGVDPETGAFDIDIITTGQSHSQRTQVQKILEIIENLTVDKKTAAFDEIVAEAENAKISKQKTKEIIEKLSKSGEIYEPRPFNFAIPKKN